MKRKIIEAIGRNTDETSTDFLDRIATIVSILSDDLTIMD